MEHFYRWPADLEFDDDVLALIVIEADGRATITAPQEVTAPDGYVSLDDAVNWAATYPWRVYVRLRDGAMWPSKYAPLVH